MEEKDIKQLSDQELIEEFLKVKRFISNSLGYKEWDWKEAKLYFPLHFNYALRIIKERKGRTQK